MTRRPMQMPLPEGIDDLTRLFEKAGFELYVVGGAVRDFVMGLSPKDYDLATDAIPDQVIDLLERGHGWTTDLTGKSFGVVRARGTREGDLHEYEIATFRQDVGEGRRPDSVVFTSIEEDVKRRDLTINALFYDIARQEVVDLVGGLPDIANRIIRTVGDPNDRFREDRLRVLRTLRFAARFDAQLDCDTWRAIALDNNLDGVSPERSHDEFVRGLLSASDPMKFIVLLSRLDMWKRLFPGLQVMVPNKAIATRSVPVVLALLLERDLIDDVVDVLHAQKYTASEVSAFDFLRRFRWLGPANAYRLKRQVRHSVEEDLLVEYQRERGLPSQELLQAFLRFKLSVTGDSLLAEGLAGRELGRELECRETLLFAQLLHGTI